MIAREKPEILMAEEPKIAASILSADFGRLAEEVGLLEKAGADWMHLDVMDGHFVPNITIGPQIVASVREVTSLPLDVHLMIEEPDRFVEGFIKAGADLVSVHVEACPHLHRTIQLIRNTGSKAGVVVNPATPLTAVNHILEDVDLVLIMTVNPGFGGQTFISNMVSKIVSMRRHIDEQGMEILLEVDGGIKVENIGVAAAAGATVFVSGSGILESADYGETIALMREQIRKARAHGGFDEAGRLSAPGG